jgi:hypothetical protein
VVTGFKVATRPPRPALDAPAPGGTELSHSTRRPHRRATTSPRLPGRPRRDPRRPGQRREAARQMRSFADRLASLAPLRLPKESPFTGPPPPVGHTSSRSAANARPRPRRGIMTLEGVL